ncbi:hypothetical protein [Azospirillum sp. SYSU D00513]|uniref:hypothetical protein n=1 Tax=Azospirillum sp. SYSU D00513 TaxID=2812561 RepID=UPI001A961D65|nr:hypothetical protein [Azospirillum sp. SYSU D00513]
MEGKRRPAVLFLKDYIKGERVHLATPLNSSTSELWCGPVARYCILPTKKYVDHLKSLSEDELESFLRVRSVDSARFKNLREISQVAVSNSFYVKPVNVCSKFGRVDGVDYEIIREMFKIILSGWRTTQESRYANHRAKIALASVLRLASLRQRDADGTRTLLSRKGEE